MCDYVNWHAVHTCATRPYLVWHGQAGTLWRLHRFKFREVVVRTESSKLLKTLRAVEILNCLSAQQCQRLVDHLSEVTPNFRDACQ